MSSPGRQRQKAPGWQTHRGHDSSRTHAVDGHANEEDPHMSADQAQILAEVSEMLRDISDTLLPGEDITRDMSLLDDLGLQSIGLARLAGRIQARYGVAANVVPLFTERDDPLSNLQVGAVADHIARVLDGTGDTQAMVSGELDALVAGLAERVVGRSPAAGRTFTEDGYTGFDMLRLTRALEARFGPQSPALLVDCPTTADLAQYLRQGYGPVRSVRVLRSQADEGTPGPRARPAVTGVDDDQAAPGLLGSFIPSADGHRARNENAAVISEHAPGTVRTLLARPGGQVEVFTAGEGPPLILMHPINVGAGVFVRQFASLAGQYRLICMHHPGVGETTWDADLTPGGIARLYREVLAELGAEPPLRILGCSFGGLVAQEFALRYPAEVAALVLIGSSYRVGSTPGARRPVPATLAEEFHRMCSSGEDPALGGDRAELEELLLRCESMDTRIGLKYLSVFARARPVLYDQLPDVAVPALILHGRHDTVVPAKHAHLLYGAIPDAQLGQLTQAGHFPCLTHPGEVARLVEPFLAARADAAAARPAAARRPRPAARPGLPPIERCIIISTGRCGSTMLSSLIADEPETLSVYESLNSLRRQLLLAPGAEITGTRYWEMMSDPGLQGAASARIGAVPEEACYPAGGRWATDPGGIPPILQCTLPRMSADPDHLFDMLAGQVSQFPAQPVIAHHRMLLDLLATMAGQRRWVERTGASSSVAEPVLAALPELKVVYLTRDIPDTARSMSRHSTFQFVAARFEFQRRYGADPYSSHSDHGQLPGAAELPEEMRRLLPDQVTVAALDDLGRDLSWFEGMCAHMMGSAEQALADLKPRHLLRMRYEDIVARPEPELAQLGEFLDFADPSGWATAAAGRVRAPRVVAAQPA
jgi:pimeloyl-ACP methyl ester carboxylesterase/acyl carrier protein